MKAPNRIILKKIKLYELMTLLNQLYSSGLDYIDITGRELDSENQDEIVVSIKDEYYNNGDYDDEEDEENDEENFIDEKHEELYNDNHPQTETKIFKNDSFTINDLLDGS
jgi:hypothetical protein